MFRFVVLAVAVAVVAAQGYNAPKHPKLVHGYADDYSEPKPFEFAYNVKDDYNGEQHRQESGDAYGNVQGSYGYTDAYGLYRQVEYTADDYGFKASIKTNEPGTDNQNPADVSIYADPAPVKYESSPKKGYGHQVAHKVVAHAPSYRAQSYATPAYGHGLRAVHSGSYAGPVYGHGLRAVHSGSYAGPVYGSHARTHQRGYNAHNAGYGHATHTVAHSTGYGLPAHGQGLGYAAPHGYRAPVAVATTHQRGYNAHDGGYGHASKVVSHKVHH